jgi:hypothetical protein
VDQSNLIGSQAVVLDKMVTVYEGNQREAVFHFKLGKDRGKVVPNRAL